MENKIAKQLLKEYEEFVGSKIPGKQYLLRQLKVAYLKGRAGGLREAIRNYGK